MDPTFASTFVRDALRTQFKNSDLPAKEKMSNANILPILGLQSQEEEVNNIEVIVLDDSENEEEEEEVKMTP